MQLLLKKLNSTNLLKNHFIVLAFFILLTMLFLYPSFLTFDRLIGNYHGDPPSFLNAIWWFHHNTLGSPNNVTDDWMFTNYLQYYPTGGPLNAYGMVNSYIGIVLFEIIGDVTVTYNSLVYLSFILTGYGTFLLANYLTRNYYAALIAGIIFTFGTYHTFHANGHLFSLTTQFLPFAVLFLLKSTNLEAKKNIVIAGFFLFLVLISDFYIAFFSSIFLVSFAFYLLFRNNRFQSILRYLFVMLIGYLSALPIYLGHLGSDTSSYKPPFGVFIGLSVDLVNFVLPSPRSTLDRFFEYPWGHATGNPETWSFLGYVVIFLVIIALFKTERDKKLLWIFSGLLLGLVSLGPLLKFFGEVYEIPLLYSFLYHYIPFFDFFRAVGRASVFVSFATAILAAYGVCEIYKLKKLSSNKKFIIVCLLMILIVVEFIHIPIRTDDVIVPEIYYDISKNPNDIVVLEAPIGRFYNNEKHFLELDRITGYYQTIHEKPVYSGVTTRNPDYVEGHLQTYFLNQFIWNQPNRDIIIQNSTETGISLFNHFDIGYVIIKKDLRGYWNGLHDSITDNWMPQTKIFLKDVFQRSPDFENDELFAYIVPISKSKTPFIVLGDGWSPYLNLYRTIEKEGQILLNNPTDSKQNILVEVKLFSPMLNNVYFNLNDNQIFKSSLEKQKSYHVMLNLTLEPGYNELSIITDDSTAKEIPTLDFTARRISLEKNTGLAINHISLNNNLLSESTIILLENNSFSHVVEQYRLISQTAIDAHARNPTPEDLERIYELLVSGDKTSIKKLL